MKTFSTIQQAIKELQKGNMLIVLDNPERENQGDLIFAAEFANAEKINFMLQHCRGQICVPITGSKANQLELSLMVDPKSNTEKTSVNFTVSVDGKNVTSFGISAADRAKTIRTIGNSQSNPSDLVRPGHVFPLLAREGGVLVRGGHTEATVDLLRLAGLTPAGVICEVLNKNGETANLSELKKFSRKWNIKIVTITDLIEYIKKTKPYPKIITPSIVKKASSQLPTKYGTFQLSIYQSTLDGAEHAVLLLGKPNGKPILTRIHSKCFTGDTFSSLKCDCREQLHQSLQMISNNREGIIIYLNQEGRGIGLTEKIKAYALQEKGLDTVEANHALGLPVDARDYKTASDILHDLGVSEIILLTNNPDKIDQLEKNGIRITKRIPLETKPHKYNADYLKVKKQKLGHRLTVV